MEERKEAIQRHHAKLALERQREEEDIQIFNAELALKRQRKEDARQLRNNRDDEVLVKKSIDDLEKIAVGFESNDASTAHKFMEASITWRERYTRCIYRGGLYGSDEVIRRYELFFKALEVAQRMNARIYNFYKEKCWVYAVFTWNPKDKAITEDRTSWWQKIRFPNQKFYKEALKYQESIRKQETIEGGPPGGPQVEGA